MVMAQFINQYATLLMVWYNSDILFLCHYYYLLFSVRFNSFTMEVKSDHSAQINEIYLLSAL